MAQMERKETITYRWWNEEVEEISFEDQESLEQSAKEQINASKSDGCTSGQLIDEISGDQYTGWWEMTTEVL